MGETTSARAIMEASQFEVELPISGFIIRFRKITNLDMIVEGAAGPVILFSDFTDNGKEIDLEKLTHEEKIAVSKKQVEGSRIIVMAAAVQPRIVDRDWNEIDLDEEIHIKSIEDDIVYAAMQILYQSGKVDKLPDDLPFFRRAVASPVTPDGGKLRQGTDGISGDATGEIVNKRKDVSPRKRSRSKKKRTAGRRA